MRSAKTRYTLLHYFLPLVLVLLVGIAEVKGQRKCNAANSHITTTEGTCVCPISGAGNSTDLDTTNATTLNATVAVLGSVYQRLIFPYAGTSEDKIRLTMESPSVLLDLSVLGGITINVMNGTSVVTTYASNSALLNLQLLSGNKKFVLMVPATGIFDRIEVRMGSGVGLLGSIKIYGAEIISPDPTVSATGQSICSGNSTTLTATPLGGTTLQWYSALTGGTLLQSGNSYTTPVLTSTTQTTTTYYIEVSKGTCKKETRVPVTVTVYPRPHAPPIKPLITNN